MLTSTPEDENSVKATKPSTIRLRKRRSYVLGGTEPFQCLGQIVLSHGRIQTSDKEEEGGRLIVSAIAFSGIHTFWFIQGTSGAFV